MNNIHTEFYKVEYTPLPRLMPLLWPVSVSSLKNILHLSALKYKPKKKILDFIFEKTINLVLKHFFSYRVYSV